MSLEYKTWLGIKRRCNSPKSKDWPNYGAKGICVSPEWNQSFENFLNDMGARPSPDHQIDRIDPSGNYEAGNCRWVTPTVQGQENKRSNIPVVVDGIEFASLSAACRHYGVNKTAVSYRIAAGISADVAVKTRRWALPSRRSRESYLPKAARIST